MNAITSNQVSICIYVLTMRQISNVLTTLKRNFTSMFPITRILIDKTIKNLFVHDMAKSGTTNTKIYIYYRRSLIRISEEKPTQKNRDRQFITTK